MKKFKLFLGLIVVIFISLLIYQNRAYFLAQQELSFSLGVETWHWTAPAVQNVVYMGACLLVGLLYAGFVSMTLKLKAKKTLKRLNAENAANLEEIANLKNELEKYEADPYQTELITDTETNDMDVDSVDAKQKKEVEA